MNIAAEFEPTRTDAPPPHFEKPSFTLWFVRRKVVVNILMNWEELRAYITFSELVQSNFDTQFKAKLLKEMLSDYKNYLFFEFATPVVQECEILNSLFIKLKLIPWNLYQQLFLHQKSLQNRL